tara:strand:- start:334 stop:585 length:252 start_codon:yes stop_codon:yes gene_type:complete
MALTTEQQETVDMAVAIENARHANQVELLTKQAAMADKQNKIEMLRMAKEVLLENSRNKPAAEATDISPADITAFANTLFAAV